MTRLSAPVQWFGGKGGMVAKLLPLIPYSKIYCEPFGGAGSILWNRDPSPSEIYNDLDGDLVNLFRAIQDEGRCHRLQERLAATLYSFDEFRLARKTLANPAATPDERAWAFYVAKNQGFSGQSGCDGSWGRAFIGNRGMASTVSRWWGHFDLFPAWHKRIARVQIDCRDALQVIQYWDSAETVFYLDPPYALATRVAGSRDVYAHEMDDSEHARLVDLLLSIKGQVVLSGYDTPVYGPLEKSGWIRHHWDTVCMAAGRTRGSGLQGVGSAAAKCPRREVVWRNPRCLETGRLL